MTDIKKYDIVYIEWHDAYTRDSWEPESNAIKNCTKMMTCKTVGHVLNATKKQITISHTRNPLCTMGMLHIPVGCIKRLEIIKVKGFKAE